MRECCHSATHYEQTGPKEEYYLIDACCRPLRRLASGQGRIVKSGIFPALLSSRNLKQRIYAAFALDLAALRVRPSLPTPTSTVSPSATLPARISSASWSCSDFWITRFNGRAP